VNFTSPAKYWTIKQGNQLEWGANFTLSTAAMLKPLGVNLSIEFSGKPIKAIGDSFY
jgi:hypothetical protein